MHGLLSRNKDIAGNSEKSGRSSVSRSRMRSWKTSTARMIPNGTYYDATPAKVKEILLSLNPGPHAAERDQLVAELDAGDRSNNLKRRCVAMCSRHYSSTTHAASQREPLRLRVCPQCMRETPTKLAICHHCLAIFDCVGRKEYINVRTSARMRFKGHRPRQQLKSRQRSRLNQLLVNLKSTIKMTG